MSDHHGASEIDAVEMNRGAGIGAGHRAVRADAADGHLRRPGCCDIVTVGTTPARPSTVCTPICSRAVAGSTVMAMGVDWISAAPVFVAVTVTLSETEDTASTRFERRCRRSYFDLCCSPARTR